MKKYIEMINTVDEEGNVLHTMEREISADEVIQRMAMGPQVATVAGIPVFVTKTAPKTPKAPKPATAVPLANATLSRRKVCKGCGEPGHMLKTCPAQRIKDRAEATPENGSIVGMTLHYAEADEEVEEEPVHPDDRTPAPREEREFNAPKDGAMSRIDFIKVKELQDKGTQSVVIASKFRLNLRETNKAMNATTYAEYERLRKT